MRELIIYGLGICGVIGLGCFISWILEVIYDGGDYRNRVTAEDLAEMARYFDEDGWFVDYNDKGEKFICGYRKS